MAAYDNYWQSIDGDLLNGDYGEYNALAFYDGTIHATWSAATSDLSSVFDYTDTLSLRGSTSFNQLHVTADASGQDAITVKDDPANPSFIQVAVNGVILYDGLSTAVNKVAVAGSTGNDALTVDESIAALTLAHGISDTGGTGTGTNSLTVLGSATAANTGTLSSGPFAINGLSVAYSNVQSFAFDGGSANDTLTIAAQQPFTPTFVGKGGSDVLNVNAGTFAPAGDLGASAPGLTVNVNDGAAVTFAATQNLAALNIDATSSATLAAGPSPDAYALNLASLTVAGKLDLTSNAILLSYGVGNADPDQTIRGYLASGYGTGGNWAGTSGIVSSAAALAPSTYALGYRDNFPNPGQITVMYTIAGDANLDGKVDVVDLGIVSGNFGTTTGMEWGTGDFNYDGKVDVVDLGILSTNFGMSLPSGGGGGASPNVALAPGAALTTGTTSAALPSSIPSSAAFDAALRQVCAANPHFEQALLTDAAPSASLEQELRQILGLGG